MLNLNFSKNQASAINQEQYNLSLFTLYQDQIFNSFKERFKNLITQSVICDFNKIMQATIAECGLGDFSPDMMEKIDTSQIKKWFLDVYEQNFLMQAVLTNALEEIIVHSEKDIQVITREKKESLTLQGISDADLQLSFEVLSLKNGVSWNYATPFASFFVTLFDQNFRATLIHHSATPNKNSKLSLRFIAKERYHLDDFQIPSEVKNFLFDIFLQKENLLICGATGSGKTSFLSALLNNAAKDEHIIVLEDTHEIAPCSSRQTNLLATEGLINKELKDYCAYAMRLRPDRIIIGEMRSKEIVPFILSMNNGHRGLMSTIHAESGQDAISRMTMLFSMYSNNPNIGMDTITKLICTNLKYVVALKYKKVCQIIKILGSDQENVIYETLYENSC